MNTDFNHNALFFAVIVRSALRSFIFVMAVAGFFMCPPLSSPAFGESKSIGKGLLVAPTRLVLEGRTRSGTLKVMNRGTETTTFKVSLTDLFEKEKEKAKDAQKWIRFSPRRMTLGPNEHQTIRILVRKPADLPAGDYIARIVVQAIPPTPEINKEEAPRKNIKIKLNVVYGLSVAIHIKHTL